MMPQAGAESGDVALGLTAMIQTSKQGARIMRYELADHEWAESAS
jgi:hypothetical protein